MNTPAMSDMSMFYGRPFSRSRDWSHVRTTSEPACGKVPPGAGRKIFALSTIGAVFWKDLA